MIIQAYQKPTMQVVQLQPHTQILAGSPDTLSGKKGEGSDPDTWQDLG